MPSIDFINSKPNEYRQFQMEVMLGGSPESNVGIRDGQSLTALVKLCVLYWSIASD